MTKALPSYRNRPGFDCEDIHNEDEPCWGHIYGSSIGFQCDGHRGGGYRTPEQAEAKVEEGRRRSRELTAQAAAQKAREEAESEARRWFRPHIERARKTPPGPAEGLSDPMLRMAFSMIGAGIDTGGGPKEIPEALIELGIPVIAEVISRGLPWPEYPYQLKLDVRDEDLDLDVAAMSDVELKLWYGCAALVMDFSCLNAGVREIISFIYHVTREECEKRTSGYLPFLCDMTVKDLKEGWDD